MSSLHIFIVICGCLFVPAKSNTQCLSTDTQILVIKILWATPSLVIRHKPRYRGHTSLLRPHALPPPPHTHTTTHTQAVKHWFRHSEVKEGNTDSRQFWNTGFHQRKPAAFGWEEYFCPARYGGWQREWQWRWLCSFVLDGDELC